ncbi:MAG: AAA family ATPase [Chloroflexi bacterium]|nr:AAA family ATPase [Chloroflexota bacterium]
MKLAVSGKGGSGKTTLSATLARLFARRGYSVLAIDGDPNPNLGVALGITQQGLSSLHALPRTILQEHADPYGAKQLTLTQPMSDVTAEHGVVGPDNVTLLLTAHVDHPGAG